jgi:hypothetical protein
MADIGGISRDSTGIHACVHLARSPVAKKMLFVRSVHPRALQDDLQRLRDEGIIIVKLFDMAGATLCSGVRTRERCCGGGTDLDLHAELRATDCLQPSLLANVARELVSHKCLQIFQTAVEREKDTVSVQAVGAQLMLVAPQNAIVGKAGDGLRYNLTIADPRTPKEEIHKWGSIYRDGSPVGDLSRRYGKVFADVFLAKVDGFLAAMFGPNVYQLRQMSLIASSPGCTRQAAHTDVPLNVVRGSRVTLRGEESEIARQETRGALLLKREAWTSTSPRACVPLSIIIAVQADTSLLAWLKSHQDVWPIICEDLPRTRSASDRHSQESLLSLVPGMCAIFSCATVHAGASLASTASEPHLRVHVYADLIQAATKEHPLFRAYDTTGLVEDYGAKGAAVNFFRSSA